MSEKIFDERNQKTFLKSAKYILRYMQSGGALLHMDKDRVVRMYELLAERFDEAGKIEEAEEYRHTAEEYKTTSRYCDELENILNKDLSQFYSSHYKSAYQNLLNGYIDLGNTLKILQCEKIISHIERKERRSKRRAPIVNAFGRAKQTVIKQFKYRLSKTKGEKYRLIDYEKTITDFVENEVVSAKETTYSTSFGSNELLISKPAFMPKYEGTLWIEVGLHDDTYNVSASFTYSFDERTQPEILTLKTFPHISLTKELYGSRDFTLTLPQKCFHVSEKQEVVRYLLWFVDEMIVLYNAKCRSTVGNTKGKPLTYNF